MSIQKFYIKLISISVLIGLVLTVEIDPKWFPLNIIHVNDMHARFEETSVDSFVCKTGEKCIGGYPRVVTTVKKLQDENKHLNPIYLNAGDNFQGTLYYSIFKWDVVQYFLNLLPPDAMTLGNHEFDDKVKGAVPFLEHIKFPIVVANIDDSQEPTIQNKYKKSTIIERNGRNIGIVGVIIGIADTITHTEKLKFLKESDSVRKEAGVLKNQGANIIIVLSHCGIDIDRQIARDGGPDIDIIVGGHSHTFLFSGLNPPGTDRPQDSYPVVEKQPDGREVLIVQASSYTKYVGNLTVFFDDVGNFRHFEGAPIYMGSDVIQDPEILRELVPWKTKVDEVANREIGEVKIDLSKENCKVSECSMGSFLADAYADYFVSEANETNDWSYATIGLVNSASVRANFFRGVVTYADIITAAPYENTIDCMEIQGKYIREAFEVSVNGEQFRLLQISGLKVTYNISNPINERVVEVKVLCRQCEVPKYESLEDEKWYRVVTTNYLTSGKDRYTMIPQHMRNLITGKLDIVALEKYLKTHSPIILIGPQNRTTILK